MQNHLVVNSNMKISEKGILGNVVSTQARQETKPHTIHLHLVLIIYRHLFSFLPL